MGKRSAARRERVADALFERDVLRVQARAKLRGAAKIGARGEDAERAAHPRHARAIGPVRRLAGLSDDAEYLRLGEMEDGQPVEPFAAGTGVAFASFPGNALGAIAALVAAQSESAHNAAFEARVLPEVAPQFALDGPALRAGRAVSASRIRESAALLDLFEKGLAGGDPREHQRHARRDRVSKMRDRLGPLDLAERGVNDEELLRAVRRARAESSLPGCPCLRYSRWRRARRSR